MNCKPGDLAVFVSGKGESLAKNAGRLFDVLRPAEPINGEPSWWVKPVGVAYSKEHGAFVSHEGECLDRCLRPIRDPGVVATDETLQWLPVPSRERETA